ncbi:MAG: TIGR02444 family protein [Proteobacteria bacterium]|nr:TIGR02444 family protein [Pseudomonadota bacterium]
MDFNDHPLWKFSLAVYGAPGVSAACLDLQERRGADVNLVLYAAFVGASGRGRLSPAELEACRAATRPWSEAVVQPLRRVRRDLKGGIGAVPGEPVQALRRAVQALELEAERLEQMTLAARLGAPAPAAADRQADALANMQAYLAGLPAADRAADAAALAAIAGALPPSA